MTKVNIMVENKEEKPKTFVITSDQVRWLGYGIIIGIVIGVLI